MLAGKDAGKKVKAAPLRIRKACLVSCYASEGIEVPISRCLRALGLPGGLHDIAQTLGIHSRLPQEANQVSPVKASLLQAADLLTKLSQP